MQPERVLLPFLHDERCLVVHMHRFLGDGAVDLDQVGAGDGPYPVPGLGHPRHLVPVLEPDDQLARHLHLAPEPLDQAEDAGMVVARRHEVRYPQRAGGSVPLLHQYKSVLFVGTTGGRAARFRGDQPAPVGGSAKESGKAGGRVEPGHAQPVDGTVPPYKCGRMSVADQGVILYALAHAATSRKFPGPSQLREMRPGSGGLVGLNRGLRQPGSAARQSRTRAPPPGHRRPQ